MLFLLPKTTKYTCLKCKEYFCMPCSISKKGETVIGWKAGSSVAYCEPCFKKVMEESELKAVVSTLKHTAPGPDELPFWIWRDYAYQLVPTITKVF